VYACVVRPLDVVDFGAVLLFISTIKVVVVFAHQADGEFPVPDLLSIVGVSLVTSVLVETSCHVEEASIGDGILVGVTIVELEDLPPEATTTRFLVLLQVGHLRVEYTLSK
jgi:hypothetical protein